MNSKNIILVEPGVLSFIKEVEIGELYSYEGEDAFIEGMTFRKGYTIRIVAKIGVSSYSIQKNGDTGYVINKIAIRNLLEERQIVKIESHWRDKE